MVQRVKIIYKAYTLKSIITTLFPTVEFLLHFLVSYCSRVSLCKLKDIIIFPGHLWWGYLGLSWEGLMGAGSGGLHGLSPNGHYSQRTQNCTSDLNHESHSQTQVPPWLEHWYPHLACVKGKAQSLHENRKPIHFLGDGWVQQADPTCQVEPHLRTNQSPETASPFPVFVLILVYGMHICVFKLIDFYL